VSAVSDSADPWRRWGYLMADLDPLGRLAPFRHPDIETTEARRDAAGGETARWRAAYCGPIGVEFMHLPQPERIRFITGRMERPAPPPAPEGRQALLERLASAELFERFLHQRYVGTKRYSLEGTASLIPLLDAVLGAAAAAGAGIAVVAMSHRGRLNVMHHIVGVPPASIFAGFEDLEPKSVLGGGDVKYHKGATGTWRAATGEVAVHLVSNPSHLEAVDPVAMGRARARQDRCGAGGRDRVLPVTLHGDAAFAGQGIAAETLNLADLPGYSVGGTIQVIVNNLIGFTTEPPALHSSRFASDVAKRLDVPIIHVNGLDPEAVQRAGRLAAEYRAAFHTDVVLDLIGFRRYGHSEVDDPTTTQPRLYRAIGAQPMLWQAYAGRLGLDEDAQARLQETINAGFEAELERGRAMNRAPSLRSLPAYWDPYVGGRHDESLEVPTAVAGERLAEIARLITTVPGTFQPHPKIARGLEQRLEMGSGLRPVDWGMAEALAFGSLLFEGIPVRLSGQDSRRGTFNQRHAALFDERTGEERVPLRHLKAGQGRFDAIDSPLSEASVLGFEFGYSRDYPEALVLWEAQFGDFANGAQVIIDQFLVAAETKWGLLSGLVLLLPHGYEGQGPEHSSARLERFLALAGDHNIQVCQPTTAAQYFHLLRRQALRPWRKPLVVATPKGMLRSAAAASPLEAFTAGAFRTVIPEDGATAATRVLLCSGKITHELRAERERRGDRATAVVRLEQLYPFPAREIAEALARHPRATEIVWVQEEPRNMGALGFIQPRLQRLLDGRHVRAVSRSESASPATGSHGAHLLEQEALLSLAFVRAEDATDH
jgi:2-oxoglutarate dehydrogenase E1 component